MRLTILGTGNAMVTDCFNTCFALSKNHHHFLVDTGGGNRILKVLKETDIKLKDIHDIFVTHEHIDHLLGVIWLIRSIGTMINTNQYEGKLKIYCHSDLVNTILTIANLTIQKKITKYINDRILFEPLHSGQKLQILDYPITFFDIYSSKAKQYGFTMTLENDIKFTCIGDEPFNEKDYKYVKNSDWLMHEAFCLYHEADIFKPYEKHHSTVKEACQLAEKLNIPNLILYHTEETHLNNRKDLYVNEGQQFYHGNLYVPDDLEIFEI